MATRCRHCHRVRFVSFDAKASRAPKLGEADATTDGGACPCCDAFGEVRDGEMIVLDGAVEVAAWRRKPRCARKLWHADTRFGLNIHFSGSV
jgi:hypothetical protein